MQELESKGLMSQDIDAALQEVFGDDMAVSLQHKGYEDEDDDDKFNTTDTRFGGCCAPHAGCLHGTLIQCDVLRWRRASSAELLHEIQTGYISYRHRIFLCRRLPQ